MADTPSPNPPTPPKRVRRWPTAVLTCLLTLVAAYLIERYALPTQGWWVAHNRDRHPSDTHYLEGVVYSKALSPEAKVGLIGELVALPNGSPVSDQQFVIDRWLSAHMEAVSKVIAAVLNNPRADDHSLLTALRLLETSAGWLHREGYPSSATVEGLRRSLWDISGPALRELTNRPQLSNPVRARVVVAWASLGAVSVDDRESKTGWRHCLPVDFLIDCLSDPDVELRTYAARCLGYTSTVADLPKAAAALRAKLPVEPESVVSSPSSSELRITYYPSRDSSFDQDPHRIHTPSNYPQLEIVHSLGRLNWDGEAGESARVLLDLLNKPRPPFPPLPRRVEGAVAGERLDPKDPWVLDQYFRAEAIIALSRFRTSHRPTTDQADAVVLATLKTWSPECPWTDFAVLAAALYLGRCDHPEAGPALLSAFREVKATCLREAGELRADVLVRAGNWSTTPQARGITLTTLAEALSRHPSVASQVMAELASVLPLTDNSFLRPLCQPLQTRVPRDNEWLRTRGLDPFNCPPPRVAWWHPIREGLSQAWSVSQFLERIGPPAKTDLPNLRTLLDYDGKGITDDTTSVEKVRQEAARALLRDATAGVKDRRPVLEQISTDPMSHPRLIEEAKAQLQLLPPAGK